jgi:hypothetical protein
MFQLPAMAGDADGTIHRLAGPLPLAPGGTWPDPVIARALAVFQPGVIYTFGTRQSNHVLSVLDAEGAIAGQTPFHVGRAGTSGLAAVPLEMRIGADGSVRFVSKGISSSPWLGSKNGFGGLVLSETAVEGGSRFVAGALIASDNGDRPLTHVLPFARGPELAGIATDSLWGIFPADARHQNGSILNVQFSLMGSNAAANAALINSAGDFVLAPYPVESGQRSMIRTLTISFSGLEMRVMDGGRDLLLAGEPLDDGLLGVLLLPAVQGGSLRDGAGGAQGSTIQGSGLGTLALTAQNTYIG